MKNKLLSPRSTNPRSSTATVRTTERKKSIKGQKNKKIFDLNFSSKKIQQVNSKVAHVNFNVVEINPKVILTNRSSSMIVSKGSNSAITELDKRDSGSEVTTIKPERMNSISIDVN